MNVEVPPANLLANSFVYETCLDWVASLRCDASSQMRAISSTANVAWQYHPGRFADGALENWAFRAARESSPWPDTPTPLAIHWTTARPSSTLHVASEVHDIGGHTRILAKWIARDRTANHAVLLTNQRTPVPTFVEEAVARAQGGLFRLTPSDGAVVRAAALRRLSEQFDRVVLHQHPYDPVPTLAFATPDGPPVVMFNHAHFGFSLGATVSDLVVNTFHFFQRLSERHRFARQTTCLPLVSGIAPLTDAPIDRQAAKIAIGADSRRVVLLSVGHETYFRPALGYDFFRTARRLLQTYTGLQIFVMAVRPDSPIVPLDLRTEPRCHFLGAILDPVPYYRATDIFLESFPMPSLGGPAEAFAHGEAFPVPVYGPTDGVLRVPQEPLFTFPYRPTDEDDYVAYIGQLLARLPEIREEARQGRAVMREVERQWEARLADVNELAGQLRHAPEEVPPAAMVDSEDCRNLASLRGMNLGETIDELLPFPRAARAHLVAAACGFLRPREALDRVVRRGRSGVVRRFLGRTC